MVKFSDLNTTNVKKDTVMTFNGKDIKVKSYLPIRDKYDLIMITLQKSKEDGLYNPIKVDIFFHLHLVYMYTDIEFSDEDRANEENLYDKLVNSGFMLEFLHALDEEEYDVLFSYLQSLIKDNMKYRNSAAAVIQSLIQDLPANAAAARDIKFAEAANGGRPLNRKAMTVVSKEEADDTSNDWK